MGPESLEALELLVMDRTISFITPACALKEAGVKDSVDDIVAAIQSEDGAHAGRLDPPHGTHNISKTHSPSQLQRECRRRSVAV